MCNNVDKICKFWDDYIDEFYYVDEEVDEREAAKYAANSHAVKARRLSDGAVFFYRSKNEAWKQAGVSEWQVRIGLRTRQPRGGYLWTLAREEKL